MRTDGVVAEDMVVRRLCSPDIQPSAQSLKVPGSVVELLSLSYNMTITNTFAARYRSGCGAPVITKSESHRKSVDKSGPSE